MTNTKHIPMTVRDVHQETEGLLSVQLQPSINRGQFDFRAGQYVSVSCKGKRDVVYAIASEPEEKRFIEFLAKDTSKNDLAQVKPDEEVRVSTPTGPGFPIEKFKGKNVMLVGMGTGLSPLRSVLKSILRQQQNFGSVRLVYGIRRPQDKPFQDDFNVWVSKIQVDLAASQPGKHHWQGFLGRVTGRLEELQFSPENLVVCVCGSSEMQNEVREILIAKGVKSENILTNQ